jgi:drug/metabolite transporter (DMT)-like permease
LITSSHTGIAAALAAAALFGAGTPLAKLLLENASPWLLAGLLYLGSGVGLWLVRTLRRAPAVRMVPGDRAWLAGAATSGGVLGPVLLMLGLANMPAANASLLLNAEGVLTALLAWFVFRENVDRRIALGMAAIVLGSVVLSWPTGGELGLSSAGSTLWPSISILCACLAWAVDNNLTRKVSLTDASYIAMVKGLTAGATNLVLALLLASRWPQLPTILAAATLGFLAYGVSLVLFVIGLRHLGTARTGAYFSVAPFFGAALAIGLLGESVDAQLTLGGTLMAIGVALHLTERHEHPHTHEPLEHIHEHSHAPDDPHHEHAHDGLIAPGTRHSHVHRHNAITHEHAHFPDAHHQHSH